MVDKNKPEKKKVSAQQDETPEVTSTVIVTHCEEYTFDWHGVHLRPKNSASSHKNDISKVKCSGMHEVTKKTKIKVNHQMDDLISLHSASQANKLKQKD